MYSHTLLEARVASLEQVNEAASERKTRRKERIQKEETLSQVDPEIIVTQRDAEVQLVAERREGEDASR